MQRYLTLILSLILGAGVLGCASIRGGRANTPEQWRASLQAPLEEATAARLAEAPALVDALRLALERSPNIAAARRRWLAAIHVEPQATSLPDPMLQAGFQFDSVETRAGPQRGNLGVTQSIPWWRKLWARGRRAATEAEIARLRYEAAARDLIVDVKDAWYELYYLDRALPVTEQIEQMLRNDAILAYAELQVGRAQLNEAFRAESQAAQLAYDRILLTEQRAAQAERLRALLNLPPGTELGPVGAAPVYAIEERVDALYERAERYAEILKIKGFEIERAQYNTLLARLSRIPDIGLGLNYVFTDPSRAAAPMVPPESGKDPVIGMASMNLPIWEQRTRALIREKEALEEAMRLEALDRANRVRQAVAAAFFRVRLTERLARLYADTLLPQADSVMRQAEIYFRNDQGAFSSVIETTLAYHNFLLAHQRAMADYGQAIGRLERVLGTTAEARTIEDARTMDVEREDRR